MADTNSPNAPKRAKAREREREALALRIGGATYEQIGRQLGVSAQAAHKAVVRALERTAKQTEESADQLRAIELARLERLHLEMYRRALAGDYGAVDRCLRIAERRARLLGLDRPQALDVTGSIVVTDAKEQVGGISGEDV